MMQTSSVCCSFLAASFLLLLVIHHTLANRGYLVVAPSVFRPNTEEVISITILQPSLPIYVETKLYSADGDLVSETGQDIFGKGTMKLKIPQNVSGRCNLKICGNCVRPKVGSYTFYNSSVVMVQAKGASAFVTTDRPIYKPDQRVYINIISTGPDLRPYNDNMLVYVEDPRGSRVIQWQDIRPACCGMLNLSYPISDQPLLGKWRVVVDLQGQTYNSTYEIQKYVLPKFEVTVYPPTYIPNWKRCESIYVRARYLYGKEVEGHLTVSTTVKGVGYYKDFVSSTNIKHTKIAGVASFNVCVHHLITKPVGEHFRGVLHIEAELRTADGSSMKINDNTCLVHKQLIDVKFSPETRGHFKPGLPYKGKVLVTYPDGSPADNVTVRIKADVNAFSFVNKNYVSSAGQILFNIPSLPSMASSVWLEAKVTQIGEEPVERSYFPTYMSISSWYSPSKCHILIDGTTHTLRVGEDARFYVHSTCTCNFTMYYEVMSRGNIVQSGIHFARNVRPRRDIHFETFDPRIQFDENIPEERDSGEAMETCKIFVKFPVTHEMAPLSRLLAYYVKETGEGVADTLTFKVHPAYRNKMSIALSTQISLPSQDIKLHVQTNADSYVCLTAIDQSVLVLKPEARLSTEQVFQELQTYDLTLEQDSDSEFWTARPRGRRRSRRSAMWWQTAHTKDAQFAFEESGVLVMTDKVRLNFREEPVAFPGLMFHRPGPGFYQIASLSGSNKHDRSKTKRRRKRSYFPETWFVMCFNVSSSSKYETVKVTLPDSLTSWQVDGVSMSPTYGLALADPVRLRTFQKFFVDFTLPYSVIRGEQVRLPLTVYNYLRACVRVHLVISTPKEVEFAFGDQSVSKLCVGSEDTKTLFYTFVFSQLGRHNITATADAYYDSRCCSGVLVEPHGVQVRTATDTVHTHVLCQSEGVPKHYTHSVFFCPKESVHLSTPNRYELQYIRKPSKTWSLTFATKASNDVHISLSGEPADNPDMLEVVLGGRSNTYSWITSKDMTLVERDTEDILAAGEFRTFTLSWENGRIQVAYGEELDENSVFLEVDTDSTLAVEYIGFSTGWGATGEFKITWNIDDMDSTYREVFYLGVPDNYIEGSVVAKATVVGDVMGASLSKLDKLLQLPYGCGEQNMIHFAPNVYVLRYLERTEQLTGDIKHTALQYLIKGYQRQLTYRRNDGSFSAFGERDATGNMWLTAFVVKSFAQARQYMYVDVEDLKRSTHWMLQQQRPDGSFPSTGRLMNKDMQGGLNGRVSLTSYVLVTLAEIGLNSKADKEKMRAAQRYLEQSIADMKHPYTLALSAYALTLLHSPKAAKVMAALQAMATKRVGATYWRYHGALVDEDAEHKVETNVYISSAEVEIAAYALLTLTAQGDVASALPIVKWLSQQRNSQGGFHSTQDTCVALQALAEYAALTYSSSTNLTVSLASTNMDLQQDFEVTPKSSRVLQSTKIPSLPAGLFVSAEGDGCALLQIDVSYNIPDPSLAPSFSLNVRVARVPGRPRNNTHHARHHKHVPVIMHDYKVKVEACVRWLHPGSSNMAVLEVELLSGFEVDTDSLEALLKDNQHKLKRYEMNAKTVFFYFDEVRSECAVCVWLEAFRRHVVGRTQPASVRVYDYYEPGYESTVFYNASHLDLLAKPLCDNHDTCNHIQEHVAPPESAEDCNSILGCFDMQKDLDVELCTCELACEAAEAEVCGSDGVMHTSRCEMDRLACMKDLHLEVMPDVYCHPDVREEAVDTNTTDSAFIYGNQTDEAEMSNETLDDHVNVTVFDELYNSTMEEASVEENSTSGSDFYTDINANLTLETLVNDTSVEPENSTVDYADVPDNFTTEGLDEASPDSWDSEPSAVTYNDTNIMIQTSVDISLGHINNNDTMLFPSGNATQKITDYDTSDGVTDDTTDDVTDDITDDVTDDTTEGITDYTSDDIPDVTDDTSDDVTDDTLDDVDVTDDTSDDVTDDTTDDETDVPDDVADDVSDDCETDDQITEEPHDVTCDNNGDKETDYVTYESDITDNIADVTMKPDIDSEMLDAVTETGGGYDLPNKVTEEQAMVHSVTAETTDDSETVESISDIETNVETDAGLSDLKPDGALSDNRQTNAEHSDKKGEESESTEKSNASLVFTTNMANGDNKP